MVLELEKVQLGIKAIFSLITMSMPQHAFLVHKTYSCYLYPTQQLKTPYKVPMCLFEYLFKSLEIKNLQ
jgi:hypothetical protein